MGQAPSTEVDRAALATLPKLGLVRVEVSLPNWPYNSLNLILFAEGAAAFEELTLSHGIDQLKVQTPDAWPNLFRQARFLSAVDFVQADRFRRKVAEEMARSFSQVDLLSFPLCATRCSPSAITPAILRSLCEPASSKSPKPARTGLPIRKSPSKILSPAPGSHGITLIGRLFEEGTLGRVGIALERAFAVAAERPPSF